VKDFVEVFTSTNCKCDKTIAVVCNKICLECIDYQECILGFLQGIEAAKILFPIFNKIKGTKKVNKK
jgi:hypothetical protein